MNMGYNLFNWDSCKAAQPLWGIELQEKEEQKDQGMQEISLERNYSGKVSVYARLKAI